MAEIRAQNESMKQPDVFPRKLFFVLLAAGLLGVIAALPMMFELVDSFVPPEEQQDLETQLPLPIPLLVLLALIQNGAVFGAAIGAGLALSRRIGTGAPLLSKFLGGVPLPPERPNLALAAVVGLALGTLLAVVDEALLLSHVPAAIRELGQSIALWKRLLAGLFYGGITEELLMRLFLFSLVAWGFGRVSKAPDGHPSTGAFWMANAVVAILFGLGHLPATQALAPLTPAVVFRCLLLNGAASLVFGHLFWRRGLESAMFAHASAHVGLQIIGPAIMNGTAALLGAGPY
jgi:membrane protease YdiL (CAAX protease family)